MKKYASLVKMQKSQKINLQTFSLTFRKWEAKIHEASISYGNHPYFAFLTSMDLAYIFKRKL
jgi:hypothetical protein